MFVGTRKLRSSGAESAVELARSKKGNEIRGNRRNPLPFPAEGRQKGNVKRETRRNPLPLELARS